MIRVAHSPSTLCPTPLIGGHLFRELENTLAEESASRYRLYTEWRCLRAQHESARFFRSNVSSKVVWMLVMRGYYRMHPPTLTDCFREADCSRGTVRKILKLSQVKSYLEMRPAEDDHRKMLIHPSPRAVIDYQRMVDSFIRLSRALKNWNSSEEKCRSIDPEDRIDRYLRYAEWHIELQRSSRSRNSVRFFRESPDHTTIWTIVMRGHYAKSPPSISECLQSLQCSQDTGRQIIFRAEKLGYLCFADPQRDHRKRLVIPTPKCVSDYEAMVDMLSNLDSKLLT